MNTSNHELEHNIKQRNEQLEREVRELTMTKIDEKKLLKQLGTLSVEN